VDRKSLQELSKVRLKEATAPLELGLCAEDFPGQPIWYAN
jgi:hypothetical protein